MRRSILILTFSMLCVAVTGINSFGASLSAGDAGVIKAAGVPIYSQADFVYGSKDLGYRFATNRPPEDVQKWYREKLPGWAVNDKFGSWIIYDGKAGADMGEIMSANQVMIKKNDQLPGWHSLPADMTTEIVIMITKPQ